MSFRWAITPAALGLAATVGFVGVTCVANVNQVDPVVMSPTPTAVDADWGRYWGGPDSASGGWGIPDSSSLGSTSTVGEALSSTAADAAAQVTPSVVNIDTVLDYGSAEAAGTGIVIGSDGLVLTNHHVIEGATKITGTVVGTGKAYSATVLGYDPATDVAVIDLTDATGLAVASLGDSDEVQVGDLVVGVGNAGGDGGNPTSMEGTVTALGQTITATDQNGGNPETLNNLIGTDADIQAGQSGGPLVDSDGDVVGVDVAASSGYTGETTSGYAISIDDAKAVADKIVSGQESGTIQVGATPFLGVELADDTTSALGMAPGGGYRGGYEFGLGYPEGLGSSGQGSVEGTADVAGVAIAGVVQGSAAEQAGLAAGDTITSLNGTAVTSAEQLSSVIAAAEVGTRTTITWTDATGDDHSATVTLGEGPVG